MASVSTYLNFARSCEEAFTFYKSVFGGEFVANGFMRMRDIPPMEGMPPLPEEDLDLITHVELRILNNYSLMGSDAPESMGFKMNMGNSVHINLQIDTRTEADRLFAQLSSGGEVIMPMQDQFWGDYFGSLCDKFGIYWMVHSEEKAA